MSNDVLPEELAAAVSQISIAPEWRFHRIQDGYADGIPRAVFIDSEGEPVGLPILNGLVPLMSFVGRLAQEVLSLRSDRERLTAQVEILAARSAGAEAQLGKALATRA